MTRNKVNKKIDVYSPYSKNIIGSVVEATTSDVLQSVTTSLKCYREITSVMTPFERFELLTKFYQQVKSCKEVLAELITNETGKIIRESQIEVQRCLDVIQFSAEESKRVYGKIYPCDITQKKIYKKAYAERVPLGVIAAITPFNFPLNTAAHKIAPALAAGNTVIVKPSPQAPLSTNYLIKLLYESGAPDGIIQVLNGGSEVGKLLVQNPNIRMVTFTGSAKVGNQISKISGLKKMTLELGGNDPIIVLKDGNIDLAVKLCIDQGLGTCGQRCTAIKRIFVDKDIETDFKDKLLKAVLNINFGNPLDSKTDYGTMISEDAAIKIDSIVDKAINDGANVVYRGDRDSAMLPPVILDKVNYKSQLVTSETFGPVLPIIAFNDIAECINMVNSTKYGLQSGVITDSISNFNHFRDYLDVGTVILNDGPGFRIDSLPFGGVKNSGIGREGVISSIQEMTESKVTIF
jgi:acyl-CoA reductase-like NAD-dependent aldehyde dehydrogenase